MQEFINKYKLHMLILVFGLSLGFFAGSALKRDDAPHRRGSKEDTAAARVIGRDQASHLAVSEKNSDDAAYPKEDLRHISNKLGRRGSVERSSALLDYLESEKRDIATILNDVSFLINEGQMDSDDLAVVGEWAASQGEILALDDFLRKFPNIKNLNTVKSKMAEAFLDSISEKIAYGRKLDNESFDVIKNWMPNTPMNLFVYQCLLAKNVDLAKVYKGEHFTEADSGILGLLEMKKSIENNGISYLMEGKINDYIKTTNSDFRSFINAAFWDDPIYSNDGLANILGKIHHEEILSDVQLAMDISGLASNVDPHQTMEWVANLPKETRGPAFNQLFNKWVQEDPNTALDRLENITIPLSKDEQVNILLGIKSADRNLADQCDVLLRELGVSDIPSVITN